MNESDIRVKTAAIRVEEVKLESELAPKRTKIAKLESEIALLRKDLQASEERRIGLRLQEANLYLDFAEAAAKE